MNPLHEILEALADAEVDFIVGGGVACVLQGVERFTLDLDIAVNLSRVNLTQFICVMKALGLVPRAPVDPEILLNSDGIKMMVEEKNALVFTFWDVNDSARQVDVFLRDDLSHAALVGYVDTVELRSRKIKILTREKLLQIKEAIDPPRDKDQLDIMVLKRLIQNG